MRSVILWGIIEGKAEEAFPDLNQPELRVPAKKTFSMSDHWNSIANLLGTPSLNPMSKKSDGTAKTQKPSPPVEQNSAPEIIPEPEATKPKPEQSRLRSSWDAVAQFFGVAAPEPVVEVESAASSSSNSNAAKPTTATGKRSKPSMWGVAPAEPAEPEVEVSDIGFAPVERAETRESGSRRGARDRRPRPESAPAKSEVRTPEPREVERDFDSDIEQSESRGRRNAPSSREDRSEPIESDRRSNRRPPRRGRSADADSSAPVERTIESVDSDLDVDRVDDERPSTGRSESNRGDSGRSDSGRGEAGRSESGRGRGRGQRDSGRSHSAPAAERGPSERAPHAERPAPAERAERPSQNTERSERPDRGPRPSRPERARPPRDDRGPRDSQRDSGTRETGSREAGSREPNPRTSSRDAAHRDDRRPASSHRPAKPTGFGAGVHDDDFSFNDEPTIEQDDFLLVDDDLDLPGEKSEVVETEEREARPKRRRGRGRGRRGERSTSENPDRVDSPDSDDVDDEIGARHTKIPSWQETIGTLVATNMENHQRNPNQSRGSRGRGPRRDR